LVDNPDGGNPLFLVKRTVVTPGTVIYAEWFGAELIRAEPVFLHVGFTVGTMLWKMSATDYAQVFVANTAANEVGAVTAVEPLTPRT
jgi:hypothetical protein